MTTDTTFAVGDRVWYADNGPNDTGTVIDVSGINWDATTYQVEWDLDPDVDWYTADQLRAV